MSDWTVVVPWRIGGKSRLDAPDRLGLARAMALDTIAAAAGVARVVVVTDDGSMPLGAVDIPGLRFVAETDPPLPAERGLDAAVARGAAVAGDGPTAALLGDLAALRATDLAAALAEAADVERAVVADAAGSGTTLVTAAGGIRLATSFGDGSFARHLALGCVPLDAAPSLRRDVDTADDLAAAVALGVGPRTAATLAGRNVVVNPGSTLGFDIAPDGLAAFREEIFR